MVFVVSVQRVSFIFFTLLTVQCFAQKILKKASDHCSVEDFGAKGDGITNDFAAFQRAAASSCSYIDLNSKKYFLDNSSDDPVVLGGKYVKGKKTMIRFASNRMPLFSFTDTNKGGLESLSFVYTGNTVTNNTDSIIKKASAYLSKMKAPKYELCSVVMILNSSNLTFRQLSFESERKADTAHGISFCINVKSSDNVQFHGMHFLDCIHGFLAEAVTNCRFIDITSERRFGNTYAAPGHVMYFSGNKNKPFNRNCTIDSVRDNGNPLNLDGRCLATLAIKFCDSFHVSNIYSYHPEGLVQSFQNVRNSTFENFTWTDSSSFTPSAAVLNFVSDDSVFNNQFKNFQLRCTSRLVQIASSSALQNVMYNNTFDNFYIATPLKKTPGESKRAIFDINGKENKFSSIQIEPLMNDDNNFDPGNNNVFFDFRNNSVNNQAAVIIRSKKSRAASLRSFSGNLNKEKPDHPNKINIEYRDQ